MVVVFKRSNTKAAISTGVKIFKQRKGIDKLLGKSKRVILRIRTVFPFDFFPNTIIIDEDKISIITKNFIGTAHIQSILITNIKDVAVFYSLLFGSLSISATGFPENMIIIRNLYKRDAIKARRIIQGLINCKNESINLGKLSLLELKTKLEQIGKIRKKS